MKKSLTVSLLSGARAFIDVESIKAVIEFNSNGTCEVWLGDSTSNALTVKTSFDDFVKQITSGGSVTLQELEDRLMEQNVSDAIKSSVKVPTPIKPTVFSVIGFKEEVLKWEFNLASPLGVPSGTVFMDFHSNETGGGLYFMDAPRLNHYKDPSKTPPVRCDSVLVKLPQINELLPEPPKSDVYLLREKGESAFLFEPQCRGDLQVHVWAHKGTIYAGYLSNGHDVIKTRPLFNFLRALNELNTARKPL